MMQSHEPSRSYDIVVVGGRCAGASAAIHLARNGARVLLLERQRMPSDALSTHVIWPDGVAALDTLGVLDTVMTSGRIPAPSARRFRLCRGEDSIVTELHPFYGYDALLCVRRVFLDGALWDKAKATPGVDAFDGTTLNSLHWVDERVAGVTISGPGFRRTVRCSLVVGADGRGSTVARAVGAVEEDIVPPGRYWYFAYFSHAADIRTDDTAELLESDTETETIASMPTNDGLQMVTYGAFNEDFDTFRRDHRGNFLRRVRQHPWMERMLRDARLATPVYGFAGLRGYYRTGWGPGWVLVGDAMHQKDPIVARGINEALLGGEWLGAALAGGITDAGLDEYTTVVRQRTRSKALNARMLARPDYEMTEAQATRLGEALTTPEGLADYLLVEYSDTLTFEDYFRTPLSLMSPQSNLAHVNRRR